MFAQRGAGSAVKKAPPHAHAAADYAGIKDSFLCFTGWFALPARAYFALFTMKTPTRITTMPT